MTMYSCHRPSKYIWRAERISAQFADIIRGVFEQNTAAPPETFYKSCDGLFNLQKTTDPQLFEHACVVIANAYLHDWI